MWLLFLGQYISGLQHHFLGWLRLYIGEYRCTKRMARCNPRWYDLFHACPLQERFCIDQWGLGDGSASCSFHVGYASLSLICCEDKFECLINALFTFPYFLIYWSLLVYRIWISNYVCFLQVSSYLAHSFWNFFILATLQVYKA